jgi:hypothetical protein
MLDRKEVQEMTVDLDTFLGAVFEAREDGENVLLTMAQGEKWTSQPWGSKAPARWIAAGFPVYFCVSTVRTPDPDEDGGLYWRRGRTDLVAAHVLVLDDIGSKIDNPPPVEPSYKIETSAGNFQYGYLIDPADDMAFYEQVVAAAAAKGWTDGGAGGSYRVMRVPGSVNVKPGRNRFKARITEWNPDRCWSLDDLVAALDLDLDDIEAAAQSSGVQRVAGRVSAAPVRPDIEVEDPLLDWLGANDAVTEDKGGEWVTVICPWHDQHTTGKDTAGYSPLGRGSGDWAETRGFSCLHEHCRKKNARDLVEWARGRGAPEVLTVDPLPWLQARYVYVQSEKRVADLEQRPNGGIWLWPLDEWSGIQRGRRIPVPGRDKPVSIGTAFVEDKRTRHVVSVCYMPEHGNEAVGTRNGQLMVNSYIEPQWPETHAEPDVFLEHVAFLVPDDAERETFLDWLAWKIQNPGRRSYAVCMVASNAFGIGRSWLGRMLSAVYGGDQVGKATLNQLIGRGTSADQTYNDWAAGCQFLVVEEAKDLQREDYWHGYDTFKERVDTAVVGFRCNPKFGRTRFDRMYFNCLILSNHDDAMVIPLNDRRLMVIANPEERRDFAYYDRLEAALADDAPGAVYWFLRRRDVSAFDPIYPPMTDAKQQMIAMTQSTGDEIMDWVVANHPRDVVTRRELESAVRSAARDLGHDKVVDRPGDVAKRLWRQAKSLKPENPKHGLRVTVDGKQQEVRAIRNRDTWLATDTQEIASCFAEAAA